MDIEDTFPNYKHEMFSALSDWGFSLVPMREGSPNITIYNGDSLAYPNMYVCEFNTLEELHASLRSAAKEFADLQDKNYSGTFYKFFMFSRPEYSEGAWHFSFTFVQVCI